MGMFSHDEMSEFESRLTYENSFLDFILNELWKTQPNAVIDAVNKHQDKAAANGIIPKSYQTLWFKEFKHEKRIIRMRHNPNNLPKFVRE